MDRLIARLLRTRWLVRAAIPLLRVGLGWLFGGRVLLLEHRGRVSGAPRFVALESVQADEDGIIVASGFGRGAQWYRNLEANGVAFVTVGRTRRRAAHPRFPDAAAAERVLRRYSTIHPSAWRHLQGAMAHARGEARPEIPLVALEWADDVPA